MTFHLNCGENLLRLLDIEASADGYSKTQYINQLLLALLLTPKTLAAGSRLQGVEAYSKLCNDKLMSEVYRLAEEDKRDPIQQLFFLLEIGLERHKLISSKVAE